MQYDSYSQAQPQWQSGTDANMMEQGVFSPFGVSGPGAGGHNRMKMVGWGPGGGLFEGKGPGTSGGTGLMQCAQDPMTGQYRTDAHGNARCWFAPTTIAGRRAGGGPSGGIGGTGRSVWDTIFTGGGTDEQRKGFIDKYDLIHYGSGDSLLKNGKFLLGLGALVGVLGYFYFKKRKETYGVEVPAVTKVAGMIVPATAMDGNIPATTSTATTSTVQLYGVDLPESPWRYFKKVKDAKLVSISKLRPIRAREKGIINAKKYMQMAYDGKIERRKPSSMKKNNYGTYTILDGNSTFANAQRSGWKNIVGIET